MKSLGRYPLVLAICMAGWQGASSYAEDGDKQRSLRFAEQAGGCALVDGYRCLAGTKQDYARHYATTPHYSGVFLAGWHVVLEDIKSQSGLTAEQKQLKHYLVGFSENASHFIYSLRALRLPIVEKVEGVDQVVGLRKETIGQSMKYWVKKDTLAVDSRLFYD